MPVVTAPQDSFTSQAGESAGEPEVCVTPVYLVRGLCSFPAKQLIPEQTNKQTKLNLSAY